MSSNQSQINRQNLLGNSHHVTFELEEVSGEEDYEVDYRSNPSELNKHTVTSKVLKSAKHPFSRVKNQTEDFLTQKSNSTSSLFVRDTIDSPNVSNIVSCFGRALFYHLQEANGKPSPSSVIQRVFSEEVKPLNTEFDLEVEPQLGDVDDFIGIIFNGEQLSAECAVMSLAYIDRLLSLTDLYLHKSNWRRITLGAIVLASKVFEEQAVWNVDFLSVFPDLNINDLNQLERQFINAIQFMVTLKTSVYTKYYFELRALSEEDTNDEELTEEKLLELESRTMGYEARAKIDLGNLKRKTRSLGGDGLRGKAKVNIHNT